MLEFDSLDVNLNLNFIVPKTLEFSVLEKNIEL